MTSGENKENLGDTCGSCCGLSSQRGGEKNESSSQGVVCSKGLVKKVQRRGGLGMKGRKRAGSTKLLRFHNQVKGLNEALTY